MRRALALSALFAAGFLFSACEDGADILIIDEPSSTLLVETNADEGEGSLRAALETASSDPAVNSIQVGAGLGTVTIASSLEYTGDQALRIVGNGLVVDGNGCDCDVLVSAGGADLDLFDLTLKNGYTGLWASIPASAGGTVAVRLVRVTVEDNDGHGIHVTEGTEGTSGSSASLRVELTSSTVRRNGFASDTPDLDGIRVEESGEGDLTFVAEELDASDNAGDGVDLREVGTGDLLVDAQESTFDDNGSQPQSPTNPESGFDASETGPGSLDVRILTSSAHENDDQGIELTESGAGDLRANLSEVSALKNKGDNLLLREDLDAEDGAVPGAGGIIATFTDVTAQDADDDGADLREYGAGDLTAQIQDGDFSDNADDGLAVVQGGTGTGRLHLVRVTTEGNGGLPVTSTGTAVTEGDDQTTIVRVRSNEDSGFGSLRAALEMATDDPGVTTILFESGIGIIEITKALEFGGTQALSITGYGAGVDAEDCGCEAFLVTGSGDLTIEGLSFRKASGNGMTLTGGGNLTLRDLAIQEMEGTGILLDIPATATGRIKIVLENVSILNNGLHGLRVDDLVDGAAGTAVTEGDGTSDRFLAGGGNSAAGILLEMDATLIRGNGFRQDITDRDGVRIEEGGSGGIEVKMTGSLVTENAGDGLELKESGLGEVFVDARLSQISDNGSQPQNPDRLEDGLDIQEAGPGSVRVDFKGEGTQASTLTGNADLGIQITEEGSGDVITDLNAVVATGNGAGTLDVIEDTDAQTDPTGGSGSILATFTNVTAGQTGKDGIRLTEYGLGDLSLTGRGLDSSDNGGDGLWMDEGGIGGVFLDIRDSFFDDNGKVPLNPDDLGAGIQVVEAGSGTADIRLLATSLARNPDGGLDAVESGSGDLRGTLSVVSANNNGKDNIRFVEDLDAKDGAVTGAGSLYVAFTQITANAGVRDGAQLTEYGDGDLTGQIVTSEARSNGDDGVDATQAGAGTGQLQLVGVNTTGNAGEAVASSGVTVSGG